MEAGTEEKEKLSNEEMCSRPYSPQKVHFLCLNLRTRERKGLHEAINPSLLQLQKHVVEDSHRVCELFKSLNSTSDNFVP